MKKYILILLSFFAKRVISKHKPFVVWITWTVGKTTTTHFVYEFLRHMYGDEVYMSPYDYNWEYGLPLTILQSKSPKKNVFLWLVVFAKAMVLEFSNKYPKYLVLEYWVDHIWEMKFMTDIVSPDIWIVLNVSKNHVTQFPDFNDYIDEKTLMGKLSKKLIYNLDDSELKSAFSKFAGVETITYWIDSKATITAKNISWTIESLSFEVEDGDKTLETSFNLIWEHQVYNILWVFALWKMMWFDLEKSREILWEFFDFTPLAISNSTMKVFLSLHEVRFRFR